MTDSKLATPATNVHGVPVKPPRTDPSYAEALKRRPKGACYCDLDDEACYNQGHWSARG